MRRFLLVSMLFAATASNAATFEARSQHYAMAVNVPSGAGGDLQCSVTITDLASNAVIASPTLQLTSQRKVAGSTVDVNGKHVSVRIAQRMDGIAAWLDVQENGMIIDAIQAMWQLAPQPVPPRPPMPAMGSGPISPDATRHLNAAGAYRVGGDVKAPVVINRVDPIYSEQARKDRISGIVILEALIDKTGAVKDAMILKDLPDGLGQAALDAVKQWTFRPATLNGEPVDVIFNLTTNFKLNSQLDDAWAPMQPPPPPPPQ